MSVVVMRFLIVGPVAGALGFVLADQLFDAANFSTSTLAHPGSLISVPVLWLYGLVLVYPLGLVPAALSAFTFAKFRRSSGIAHQLFIAGAAGFCFALMFGLPFFYVSDAIGRAISLVSWGIAGLFGGMASALTCVRVPLFVSASANVA